MPWNTDQHVPRRPWSPDEYEQNYEQPIQNPYVYDYGNEDVWVEQGPLDDGSGVNLAGRGLTGVQEGVSTAFLPIRPKGHARLREPSDDTSQVEEIDLGDPAHGPAAHLYPNSNFNANSLAPGPPTSAYAYDSAPAVPRSVDSSSAGGPGRATSTRTHSTRVDDFKSIRSANPELSRFPPWSRHWFDSPPAGAGTGFGAGTSSGRVYTSRESVLPWSDVPSDRDRDTLHDSSSAYPRYSPLPGLNSHRNDDPSPYHDFDPRSNPTFKVHPGASYAGSSTAVGTLAGDRDRPISPETKAKRIKLLEKEFLSNGSAPRGPGPNGRLLTDDVIGSVDEKGKLITVGPKKRTAARVFQGCCALIAGVAGIYPALFIKLPPNSPSPPPAHKLGTYVLYVLSVITFLIHTYIFLIRRYCNCCGGRDKGPGGMDGYTQLPGMMMLPVQMGMNGGKGKGKKGKKGKKGMMPGMGDVQVNLIIDPRMLGGHGRDRDSPPAADDSSFYPNHDPDFDPDPDFASGFGSSPYPPSRHAPSSRDRRPTRRSHAYGLQLEHLWTLARSRLKKLIMYDVGMGVGWGLLFGLLVFGGGGCPTGKFGGWCQGYNIGIACSVFLVLLFGLSLFFDVRDFMASKISPRQRT